MIDHKTGYLLGEASKFGYLIAGAGVFALISPFIYEAQVSNTRILLVGITAILVGLGMKLSYNGIEIRFASREIRTYQALFGIKRGDWHSLPMLQRVVLTAENVSFWNTPNGISPTFKTHMTTYSIGLFGEAEQPHYFLQTNSPKHAEFLATTISKALELDLQKT